MKKILMAMYLIGGLAMLFSCNDLKSESDSRSRTDYFELDDACR